MIKGLIHVLFVLFFSLSALFAGISTELEYHGPTEQLIKRDGWNKIYKNLKEMKIPLELIPFFDEIATHEDWGHIGYHGANQEFRIYQDIIRFTVEEILNIPIRDNFHFFRIPGDPELNLNTMKAFIAKWGKNIDNKTIARAKQLLSLNYSIYSNHDRSGSSSLYLFVKDRSKTDINYKKMLEPFFKSLGISTKNIKPLFAKAHEFLDSEGGILFRLEEISHLTHPKKIAYEFLDQQGYPCKAGGYKYGSYPISNHFERMMNELYVEKELDISPQLRLLMNNKYTLNPYSYLNIYRWDLYESEIIEAYETALRSMIREMQSDALKTTIFRAHLLKLWE